MKLKFLFAAFVLAVMAISCQKEISSEGGFANNGGGGGGNGVPDSFLYKYISVDSLNGGDSLTLYFDYDNLKRVTHIRKKEQGFPLDTLYSFFYSGNVSLPYKTIHYPYDDEWFHFYDSQNRLIRDSLNMMSDTGHIIYNTRNYNIEEFTYAAGMILIKRTSHWYEPSNQTNGVSITTDTSLTDASINIVYTCWGSYKDTTRQTYSSTPNPISKLNIFPALHPYCFYEGDPNFIRSPNLWVTASQRTRQPNGIIYGSNDQRVNIVYNTADCPVSATIFSTGVSGGTFYTKEYFYYKPL